MELPFPLYKTHRSVTRSSWINRGLKCDDLEFEIIYNKYIHSTNCELCGKEFLKRHERQMEHSHETGYFRNICCNSCNQRKSDVKLSKKNTSGHKGICKQKLKEGYSWKFQAYIQGKQQKIKQSKDFDYLVKFAKEWKQVNNYHT